MLCSRKRFITYFELLKKIGWMNRGRNKWIDMQ